MSIERKVRRTKPEREQIILDAADRLFYARGVHEVGMDELVAATGLGKASVYRCYPTKDELIGAYLHRLSSRILTAIDADVAASSSPAMALRRVLAAIAQDVRRPEFRGCPFNNASVEFADPGHPARTIAREYRRELRARLVQLSGQLAGPARGRVLGDQLAALIDGAYTSAAHLGPDGPAAGALKLARKLIADADRS